ncbi:biotin/lipoyl-binding protein [Lachnospiraceae bacterium 47-T17]
MGKLGKAFLFLLTVMLLLTALSRTASSLTVAQVRVERPQARRIVHTVNGDGIVEKLEERPVYAAAGVLVEQVRVKEGQMVEKGDVLALLDMDSIDETIKSVSDEIEELRLLNQAIAARQQKDAADRSKARSRAQEDYDQAIANGEVNEKEADEQVEDAKQKLKDAKEQAKKQADEAYEQKSQELSAAAEAAGKEYDAAVLQEQNAVLLAKRALEDAKKEPAESYDIERVQMEISQKQRRINQLYRDMWTSEESMTSINDQIVSLQAEIAALQLQLKELANAAENEKKEREQTIARAQEDYDNTVAAYGTLVDEAKKKWDDARLKLDEFLECAGEDMQEDASVKAAREALNDAKQQRDRQARQQEEQERMAQRALEDASESGAADNSAVINQLAIAQKNRQLDLLEKVKADGGAVTSEVAGTITLVQLSAGQYAPDTAAFLMSDASGGMSFETQVSREDSAYVMAGDTVSLKSAGGVWEELSVLSVETNEDETAKVTVYVPKDTLALGAYASMELTKQSDEYGITVPVSAVHTENGRHFVYVMEPEESVLGGSYAALRMEVKVAEKNGMYAAITESSLTPESQIIVDSDHMISAGETVRLQEE